MQQKVSPADRAGQQKSAWGPNVLAVEHWNRLVGSPLALSVDAAVGTYRFVCTACGLASTWFEAAPAGLRLRESCQPQ